MDNRKYKGKELKADDVIVDMNDMKKVFRELVVNKIDEDFESMIKKYINDNILNDNKADDWEWDYNAYVSLSNKK